MREYCHKGGTIALLNFSPVFINKGFITDKWGSKMSFSRHLKVKPQSKEYILNPNMLL